MLFQGGLRRSEAAALTWGDVQDATDGAGVLLRVRRSKTDQDGTAADVRYLKNGCASAIRQLRDRLTVRRSGLRPAADEQVLGGLGGQSIGRRLTAAARAAGIDGRITGHSGRVGLASELTARGASTTETMLAGGWRTARMVAHYSAAATAEQGAVAKYL
ncbi:MAG: tyrosine-type recombinase/integrase [Spirochaetaceae bacterium]|nr:tyrosine-type recombinase/integrase [Spirochaetaceae bacterium]